MLGLPRLFRAQPAPRRGARPARERASTRRSRVRVRGRIDGLGIAAVFAADADLESCARVSGTPTPMRAHDFLMSD